MYPPGWNSTSLKHFKCSVRFEQGLSRCGQRKKKWRTCNFHCGTCLVVCYPTKKIHRPVHKWRTCIFMVSFIRASRDVIWCIYFAVVVLNVQKHYNLQNITYNPMLKMKKNKLPVSSRWELSHLSTAERSKLHVQHAAYAPSVDFLGMPDLPNSRN